MPASTMPRLAHSRTAAAVARVISIGVVEPRLLTSKTHRSPLPMAAASHTNSKSLPIMAVVVSMGDLKAPGSPCIPSPISISPGPRRDEGGWPGSEQAVIAAPIDFTAPATAAAPSATWPRGEVWAHPVRDGRHVLALK